MKKEFLSLAGVCLVLLGASTFNVYGHYSNKIYTSYASEYFFGHNVKKMCRNSKYYRGSNYRVMILRNKKDGHILGNEKHGFYTWYMNK